VGRNFLDEGAHLGLRQEIAGRIVRVGDPDQMGVGRIAASIAAGSWP
jgi:hypothetical protein